MADEFTIATDLKVEINLPTASSGVWNSSKWDDGSDWMTTAGSAFAWTDVVATVSQAHVETGGSVSNGYYVPATPNILTLQLQSTTYDPNNNKYMRPNLGIRMSYRPNPTTAPSTWKTLFTGFIDTLNVSYDTFGNNLIDITASSSLKRYLAKNLTSFVVTGSPNEGTLFAQWVSAVGADASSTLNGIGCTFLTETFTQTAAGEILDNILQVENGVIWQDLETDLIKVQASAYLRNLFLTPATNSLSNTHTTAATHFCISDIVLDYDLDTVSNSYFVSTTAAPSTILTKKNQDLIDLYGEIRLEQQFHIDSASLQYWLDNVTIKNPGRKVSQVSTPAIRRDGVLANITALMPNRTINVNVVKSGYTVNEDTFITKATHDIDPYNWFVTLEVWKGF
jgi:hypothetical protein